MKFETLPARVTPDRCRWEGRRQELGVGDGGHLQELGVGDGSQGQELGIGDGDKGPGGIA